MLPCSRCGAAVLSNQARARVHGGGPVGQRAFCTASPAPSGSLTLGAAGRIGFTIHGSRASICATAALPALRWSARTAGSGGACSRVAGVVSSCSSARRRTGGIVRNYCPRAAACNAGSGGLSGDTLQGVRTVRRLPHVDRVAVEERVATLAKRSIKTEAKQQGIRLAVSMLDLTTLEGADTPGKVRQLAAKAVCPAPARPEIPSCAAVCVYPALVGVAREAVAGTGVQVASRRDRVPVRAELARRSAWQETREAVAAGADEIDMVISRQAYLAGDDARVVDEIVQVKEACGDAHLKVILETAELPSYDHVRHASMLAMEAGADFIKTSTGKAKPGATPGVVLVMLEALRDYTQRTGRVVGMKPAGGVSTSKQALHMLVLVKETLGDEWLTPERFRIGASSVLNDLLMQYEKTQTGRYGRGEDFSKE